jgi:hypothetical protein
MDDRKNLSQPESVITTTEKSPSRNLQKKSCAAGSAFAQAAVGVQPIGTAGMSVIYKTSRRKERA